MILKIILIGFLIILSQYSALLAADNKPIKVFILAGQSNAVGYAYTNEYKKGKAELPKELAIQSDVLFWYGKNNWRPLQVQNPKQKTSFGPELSFAHTIKKHFPGEKIAIIKSAHGGTGIARSKDYNDYMPQLKGYDDKGNNWHPPSKSEPAGALYQQFNTSVRSALADLDRRGKKWTLSGLLWMQGEHEAGISRKMANDYDKLLSNFIRSVRHDLKNKQLPVIVGEINSHTWAFGDIAREKQAKVCKNDPNILLVKTVDLDRNGSGGLSHFNADSLIVLGQRFADSMSQLMKSNTQQTPTLFNGKDLSGWKTSMPDLWSVENGAIVGRLTNQKLNTSNFLISDLSCGNFKLTFKVKLFHNRGNSGIQFWSQPHRGRVKGFQADIGPGYWGHLYEEWARGLVRNRITDESNIKINDWNDYEVIAVDGHIVIKINGKTFLDFQDDGTGLTQGRQQIKGATKGVFALQMHPGLNGGKGTEIHFKSFNLTHLNKPSKIIPKSNSIKKKVRRKRFPEGKGNTLDAKAKTMREQLALFHLPEGFIIENVSHEELGAKKPISLAFDDAGRLWTQTATEYPNDNNPERFKKKGNDKILFFPAPHQQKSQSPHIFADGLVMPISVLPHHNGIHVIHGTELIKLKDTNSDNKADHTSTLMSGFGVKDSHTMMHRLTQGPGNWIYFSQGVHSTGAVITSDRKKVLLNQALIARYQADGTQLQIIGEGMNNIWAWSINREGRTYIHEANDLGYSQAAFDRDTTYPSFLATASRNPLHHPPTAPGLGLDGTGFCGIATTGTSPRDFPAEWRDFNFIANPITGEINTVSYTVDKLGNHQFTRETDLVTCDDPMFRPVNITFGPDGCLYIADWYNRTISHGTTTRNLNKHARNLGRIWRVRHQSQKLTTPPNVEKSSNIKLITHLSSNNLWEMRAAINQIGKRQCSELISQINELIRNSSSSDSIRIHALWALEALKHFDKSSWEVLITNKNQNVRHEALRSLSTIQPSLSQIFPLLQGLKSEKSYYVINELVRFFRDTPQKLNNEHRSFIQTFYTKKENLPNKKVKGWKRQYYALGGSYEKRFLNQLIESIGNKRAKTPVADEKKWSKVIESMPKQSAEIVAKLDAKITRLVKVIETKPKTNIEKGKTHFVALCAACHDSNKNGFAPPLGGGAHRSALELLTAIIKPNTAIEAPFLSYKIIKKDGNILEGFRSDLSHEAITLTFMGGAKINVPLTEINKAGYIEGKSVMLEGMTNGLKDKDFVDLIAYLRTIKN